MCFAASLVFFFASIIALLKIFQVGHRVIGKDIVPSILFILSGSIIFVNNILMELHTFDTLSKACFEGENKLKSLRSKMAILYWGITIVYVSVTFLVVLAGVVVKEYNPKEGFMSLAVVIRNLSVVLYMTSRFVVNRLVLHRVRDASSILSGLGKAEADDKVQRLFKFLEAGAKEKKKMAIFLGLLYATFTLPPLWGYQFICITATTFLQAATRRTGAKSFVQAQKGTTAGTSHKAQSRASFVVSKSSSSKVAPDAKASDS